MMKRTLTKLVAFVSVIVVTLLSQSMIYADIAPDPNIIEQVVKAGPGLGLLIIIIAVAIGIIIFIRKKNK